MKKLTLCTLALLTLAGCRLDFWRPEPVALSIVGYNYTGRYIHTFSVNGQWGGGLYDDDGGGGGGDVCCLLFRPDTKLPFDVEVEWTLNDVKDYKNDKWIPSPEEHFKKTVTVNGPLPKKKLSNFEVHFSPNGVVQAYITDHMSSPFLLRDGKRNPNIRVVPPGDEIISK